MITAVRPYCVGIMRDLGLKEWRQSLEPDNIPKVLTQDVFHVKTGEISGVKQNQRDIELTVGVTISFAKKGMRDEVHAYEAAEQQVQYIVQAFLSPVRRADNPMIKIVKFDRATPEAVGARNDNVLIMRTDFTVTVILNV